MSRLVGVLFDLTGNLAVAFLIGRDHGLSVGFLAFYVLIALDGIMYAVRDSR